MTEAGTPLRNTQQQQPAQMQQQQQPVQMQQQQQLDQGQQNTQPQQKTEQVSPGKPICENMNNIKSPIQSMPQTQMDLAEQKKTGAALPISVTTASHADPSRISAGQQLLSSLQKIQQQIQQPQTQSHPAMNSASISIPQSKTAVQLQTQRLLSNLSKCKESARQLSYSMQPQQQIRSRSSITLAAGLAAPGSGITLPSGMNNAAPQKIKIETAVAAGPTLAVNKERNCAISVNPLYSSACRASVSQQAALRSSGLKTNNVHNVLEQVKSAVVRSTSNSVAKYKYQKVVGGKPTIPRSFSSNNSISDLTPQIFLEKILKSRGYSTQSFCSLEGGYYCKPTALQKASYGIRVVQAVRQSNPELLKKLLDCRISPNPCNAFGESVVHMVCRRGDFKLLKILKDAGCSLQVTDDFGRTPLHDACWTAEPNFETVEMILNTDIRLLNVVDCRGSSPLSYVKRDHWTKWIAYFQSRIERYWSPRDTKNVGEQPPPPLCNEKPHSKPIPDPSNAISLEAAKLIASGRVEPDQYLSEAKKDEEPASVDISMQPATQVATIAS